MRNPYSATMKDAAFFAAARAASGKKKGAP